jgi:predicted secreted hydrolase
MFRLGLILPALLLLLPALRGEWIAPPLRTEAGYPVPQPDVKPVLPRAHGAHREYAIEWWYWIGHLRSANGREQFGFQSTVFRLAGEADQAGQSDREAFGDRQLFMSHSALADISGRRYRHNERVHREGWQASAEVDRLGLRVGGIQAHALPDGSGYSLETHFEDNTHLRLTLRPAKPLVSFGQRGLSRKGADPAAVSWYWTYPRLAATGVLVRGQQETEVNGLVWMDHEISSSQLGSDLEGWDWTCMQLDDGTEVKAYRLRRSDGSSDPWSAVYWIDRDAELRSVYGEAFSWEENGRWTSRQTGLIYPTRVTIRATDPLDGQERVYILRPLLDEQEFVGNTGGNPYWEGACEVLNARGERIGLAYMELAGYGGGLADQLR